jgi:hypothetical protein
MPHRPLPLAIPAALVLAACGPETEPSLAATRDSAGIEIVDNTGPAWTPEQAWRLSASPSIDIGVASGDPAYELYRPRRVFRLRDGRIVIGDAGTMYVRYYDGAGRHLLDAGGRGAGPGEFQRLSWVGRLEDDSVLVYDQTLRRFTVFDADG